MKKKFWIPVIVFFGACSLIACLKTEDIETCTPNTLQRDRVVIDSFLNGATDISFKTDLGVYTGIRSSGTGSMPLEDSLVSFKYSISLLNGTSLGTSDTIPLPQTSTGIRLSELRMNEPVIYNVLSSVAVGGLVRVIVPSSYFAGSQIVVGGGCQQLNTNSGVTIPAYSQLIYDFTLTSVRKN